MTHNQGDGGFDPRYHNAQYGGAYYDPAYQQQPYALPRQNFQIQVPVGNYSPYTLPQQSPQHPQGPHHSPMQVQPPLQQPVSQHNMYQQPIYQQQQQQQQQQQPPYANSMQSPSYQPSPLQPHNTLPPQQAHHRSPSIAHQSPPSYHHSPSLARSQLPHLQQQQNQQYQQFKPSPTNHFIPMPKGNASLDQFPPEPRETHTSPPASASAPIPPPPIKTRTPDSVLPIAQVLEAAPVHAAEEHAAPPSQPPEPSPLALDYVSLVIDLAERYFETAYGNGPKSSAGFRQMPDTFCRLVATGLACLDVVLGEFRSSLQPAVEAAVRLRYAMVLYQETENYMDAEDMLSKGLILCDRLRLTELKYNMQHLQARVMFLKNPKAAVKYLDGVIRNVETTNHVPWIYAMRFLRVALSLQMGHTQEILTAQSQLKVVSTLAATRNDVSVASMAHALDALVQIHRSTSNESLERVKQMQASARSSQPDNQTQSNHQFQAMMYFTDILLSIYLASQSEAQSKLSDMNAFLEKSREDSAWSTNGEFLVPLSKTTSQQSGALASQAGVIHIDDHGDVFLRLQWLSKDEVFTLAYVIAAAVMMPKNPLEGHHAENYLQQASKTLRLNEKAQESNWRKRLRCEIQAQTIFALCSRSSWGAATKALEELKEIVHELSNPNELSMSLLLPFLEASIHQGAGETEKALEIYTRPPLSLETAEANSLSSSSRDISILATLNALLIICLPSHPRHSEFENLFARLEPLTLDHPSRDIQAAYNLVHAVSLNTGPENIDAESASMLKTKQYLSQALQAAKRTGNNQLRCITLNFMTWRYFRGVVGEQPVKSAMSAQALARKGQNSLWMSVADGLLADTLETQGRTSEANSTRRESLELAGRLPGLMQRTIEQPRI